LGRFLQAWGLIVLGGGLGMQPDAWLGDTRLQADETATADSVQWQEALEYSRPDGTSLQLNLARPAKLNAPAPAVLCIHGGGFRAGKRDRWNTTCKPPSAGFAPMQPSMASTRSGSACLATPPADIWRSTSA
jgi:acetyl esterase/lipase